jgi:preprotein translocase subunit YajC
MIVIATWKGVYASKKYISLLFIYIVIVFIIRKTPKKQKRHQGNGEAHMVV